MRALLEGCRRGVLATRAPDGSARLVPVCFAIVDGADGPRLVTPIDEKPKASADPLALARTRDVRARPDVVLLFDRWDEDWTHLAWVRIYGTARLVWPGEAEHPAGLAALRARYPQYRTQALERLPLMVVEPARIVRWPAPPTPAPR